MNNYNKFLEDIGFISNEDEDWADEVELQFSSVSKALFALSKTLEKNGDEIGAELLNDFVLEFSKHEFENKYKNYN